MSVRKRDCAWAASTLASSPGSPSPRTRIFTRDLCTQLKALRSTVENLCSQRESLGMRLRLPSVAYSQFSAESTPILIIPRTRKRGRPGFRLLVQSAYKRGGTGTGNSYFLRFLSLTDNNAQTKWGPKPATA